MWTEEAEGDTTVTKLQKQYQVGWLWLWSKILQNYSWTDCIWRTISLISSIKTDMMCLLVYLHQLIYHVTHWRETISVFSNSRIVQVRVESWYFVPLFKESKLESNWMEETMENHSGENHMIYTVICNLNISKQKVTFAGCDSYRT